MTSVLVDDDDDDDDGGKVIMASCSFMRTRSHVIISKGGNMGGGPQEGGKEKTGVTYTGFCSVYVS
jgi:hypothetical protein